MFWSVSSWSSEGHFIYHSTLSFNPLLYSFLKVLLESLILA